MKKIYISKEMLSTISALLLIFLFVYAGINKLIDYSRFSQEVGTSPFFPAGFAPYITVVVLVAEFLIVLLLLIDKYRSVGFLLSLFLMSSFTVYIYLLLQGDIIPCSCGGILGKMNWIIHIYFNAFFVMISLIGYVSGNEKV